VIVLHAVGVPGGGPAFWGEEPGVAPPAGRRSPRAHPFACPATRLSNALGLGEETRATELVLGLPSTRRGPAPSPEARRGGPAEPRGFRSWSVPALEVGNGAALDLLCGLADAPAGELVAGDDARFWGEVGKLALELCARGRVVPVLRRRGDDAVGRWAPVLGEERDRERLDLLGRALPASGRALDGEERPAARIVRDALDHLVDACVREALGGAETGADAGSAGQAWIDALAARDPRVRAPAAALARLERALAEWARAAVEERRRPLRTCLRLVEPGDLAESSPPAGDAWRLEFLLQPADDPSLLVPAERVWRSRGRALPELRRAGADPEETLLQDLGRALRLWPPMATALEAAEPAGLDLDARGAWEFLRVAAPSLREAGLGVLVPNWWKDRSVRLGARLKAAPRVEGGGGFGLEELVAFEWRIALGDEPLSLAELRRLARLKAPLVRLRGRWVELGPEEVQAALDLMRRKAGGTMTAAEALRVGLGIAPSPSGLPVVGLEAEGWLGELLRTDRDTRLEPVAAPAGFSGTLRPYQERGLSWLAFLDRLGLGACLADDMGLGKTIQLLALLVREREAGAAAPLGPTLLVCPMSLVGNWQREAARFAPGLKVYVHHGTERHAGRAFEKALRAHDLVITTYGLVAREAEALAAVEFGRVVLDEAQNVKNSGTRQARAVRALRAARRVALTGTPVENRLSELWSILDALNPGLLGSANDFQVRFARPIERFHDARPAETLRRLTGPFILRRLKTDRTIIADLPEKLEMKVFCNLTREQATLYQAVVEDLMRELERAEGMKRKGIVLASLTRLKQVCNHPAHFLGDGSELPGRSGKLARVEELFEEALAEGERALVFTQFAEMGALLQRHLEDRLRREVLFLHGGTARRAREEMVARFQAADGPGVFLLSLKAGGTGLNLTAATHVIHFDRWWNPAVEDQATDRAFRIGQTRNVQVRKLVCVGTLEERIDRMIEEKKDLAARIVGSGEAWLTELSTARLREIVALSADAVAEG